MVMLGTYRDTDLDSNPAPVRKLEELIRDGLHPIKLNGLGEGGVAQMLHRLSSRASATTGSAGFQQTGGNPFFVEQQYQHLVEEGKIFDSEGEFRTDLTIDETDVPENVRLVLGRRLQRLSGKAREILTAAAVIGRGFSFKLLETVLSCIDADDLLAAIEEAQHMGLIVSSDGSEAPLNFTHDLVRQTLLSRISTPRRQRLHLKAAEAIEQIWAGRLNEQAIELADHLLKAGPLADAAQTAGYLLLVGRNALEGAACEEAYRSFKTAMSYKEADLRWRAECLQGMQKAKRGLGNWEEARPD